MSYDAIVLARCKDAENLAASFKYKSVICLKGITTAICVFGFLFLCVTKRKTVVQHPNTKIIYRFIFLFTFSMALSNLVIYLYDIWRLSPFVTRPCDRLWNTAVLFTIRIAFNIFTIGVNMAFIVLCVERLICICRLASYEESTRPFLISIILISLTTFFSTNIVLIAMPGMDWSRGIAVSTIRNDKNSRDYQIFIFVVIVTDILGVIFFLFIHKWSFSFRNKIRGFKLHTQFFAAQRSLSVKFQLEETLQMTSLFLPIVISKCIVQLYSAIALVAIGQLCLNPTVEIQMILYEMANVTFLVPVFSLIFIYNGRAKSKTSLCKVNWRVENTDQDNHFIQLKNMFEKGSI